VKAEGNAKAGSPYRHMCEQVSEKKEEAEMGKLLKDCATVAIQARGKGGSAGGKGIRPSELGGERIGFKKNATY